MSIDFMLEKKLRAESPQLHTLFRDTVFVLQNILSGYKTIFPEFTDHTELHSLSVAEFCNVLIGEEQIGRMNADEIYALLMACYLHDSGMGISEKDYEAFKNQLGEEEYLRTHADDPHSEIIREFHHEFSGMFIRKHRELFEIPSEEHLFAIVQASRGHRRTNLYDENEYPAALRVPGGNTICLPYLAALIRLADEIDVTSSRNPGLLYDVNDFQHPKQMWHYLKHEATKDLLITPDSFTMIVETDDEAVVAIIEEMRRKMQITLDYCRDVVEMRTDYRITQRFVLIKRTNSGAEED